MSVLKMFVAVIAVVIISNITTVYTKRILVTEEPKTVSVSHDGEPEMTPTDVAVEEPVYVYNEVCDDKATGDVVKVSECKTCTCYDDFIACSNIC